MAGAALVLLPFAYRAPYPLHIMVIILIWSFAYTSWSMMGRFGLVSLAQLTTPLLTMALLISLGGRGGVYLLVAGVVVGAALELALILAAAQKLRLPRLPRWH